MDEETNGTIILPGIQVVKSDSNKGFLSYGELYSNETNAYNETWEHVLYRIQINCEQKCQEKDCHSITYNPVVLRTSPNDEQLIVLTIPSTPTISASSQSALSLVQFLTDFGSALGFWLGISAFGLFDHFKKIFNSVLNAKQMTLKKVQNIAAKGHLKKRRLSYMRRRLQLLRKRRTDVIKVIAQSEWHGLHNRSMKEPERNFKERMSSVTSL